MKWQKDFDIKLALNGQILRDFRNLPEKLELTEHEWYEYHHFLRRNLFLLGKLQNLPQKVYNIYIMEPYESYIGSILSACGYRIHYHHTDRLSAQEFIPRQAQTINCVTNVTGEYDALLLLNILERQPEHPVTFLKQIASLLKNNGKIFLTTENIASFKNRLKLMLGFSILSTVDGNGTFNSRQFDVFGLCESISQSNLNVRESSFIGPYQPFKMEPLTLKSYLVKYFIYFVMKSVSGFRDTIFVIAEKSGEKV
jgi:hypothetical protein